MGKIRLAGIVSESFTDGIGIRYTIFTQGCNHKCRNCHNPETWNFNSGYEQDIDEMISNIMENPLLDGITISGGDPMYQTEEVLEIIQKIRERTELNIWVYTGFTFEECKRDPDKLRILELIDVLVDGEYIDELRQLQLRFRGSSNQRIINVRKSLELGEVAILISD